VLVKANVHQESVIAGEWKCCVTVNVKLKSVEIVNKAISCSLYKLYWKLEIWVCLLHIVRALTLTIFATWPIFNIDHVYKTRQA
jgi:hypothetical protein